MPRQARPRNQSMYPRRCFPGSGIVVRRHQNRRAASPNQAFPGRVRTARTPVESPRVIVDSKSWQMSLPAAVGSWAVISLLAALWGVWLGFRGRSFALALGVAAVLFAFELFLAAPGVLDPVRRRLGPHGA